MSEQINKILASTSQAFSTAEMKQARDNIGAIGYANLDYSGSAITGIGGSAVGSTGGAVYHDSNMSGSGTSAEPLGLSDPVVLSSVGFTSNYGSHLEMSASGPNRPHLDMSAERMTLSLVGNYYCRAGTAYLGKRIYEYPYMLTSEDNYAKGNVIGFYESDSAASILNAQGLYFNQAANGIGGGISRSVYRGNGWNLMFSNEDGYIKEVELTNSGNRYEDQGNTANQAIYGFGSALFTDNTGTTWEKIDADSIRRWNEPSPYQIKVYKPTTASVYLHTSDYPKFPNTADGTFVIVNLGDGPYVTYPDSLGATANVAQNQSAQLIWDSQANRWVHWNN